MKTITIYDTEYWTDEGAMARHWSGLTDEVTHVMQIGAIKLAVEPGFPEVERLNILVKPRNYKGELLPVTTFFTGLTNVTEQQILNEGLEFEEALHTFYEFAGEEDGQIYSYGGDEVTSLLPICFEHDVKFPFKRHQVWRVEKVFQRLGMPNETYLKYNSGALAEGLGVDMSDTHHQHDALCDVISLVKVLRHLSGNKDFDDVVEVL